MDEQRGKAKSVLVSDEFVRDCVKLKLKYKDIASRDFEVRCWRVRYSRRMRWLFRLYEAKMRYIRNGYSMGPKQ